VNSYKFGVREVIFAGVLLAVPIASYLFVFGPRNGQIRQAKTEMERKETRLAELHRLTGRIPDLDKEIDNWADALKRLDEKLPDQEGVDAMLGQITEIAKGNKLFVRQIRGEKAIPAALSMELPLRTTIEGSFEGFYQFMLDLEALPRITRVRQLKMSRLEPDRGEEKPIAAGAMKAEFVLSVYFDSGDQPPIETIGGKRDTRPSRSR